MPTFIDLRNINSLTDAKRVIEHLCIKIAAQETASNNKDAAFNKVVGDWEDKLKIITDKFKSFANEPTPISPGDNEEILSTIKEISDSVSAVKGTGLSDLHDNMLPPPTEGFPPASSGGSMTIPVVPEQVAVTEGTGEVTINPA